MDRCFGLWRHTAEDCKASGRPVTWPKDVDSSGLQTPPHGRPKVSIGQSRQTGEVWRPRPNDGKEPPPRGTTERPWPPMHPAAQPAVFRLGAGLGCSLFTADFQAFRLFSSGFSGL